MTYETDMFDDLESEDIPVEDDVANDAELPEADEETEADEEEPAPETDTHVFKSVEIEKNGGIFYTAYSFKAELNPQTAASEDESMIDMDIPAVINTEKAMGGADIKISTACAFLLGAGRGLAAFIIGLTLFVVIVPILRKVRHEENGEPFPMVPFLSVGTITAYLI